MGNCQPTYGRGIILHVKDYNKLQWMIKSYTKVDDNMYKINFTKIAHSELCVKGYENTIVYASKASLYKNSFDYKLLYSDYISIYDEYPAIGVSLCGKDKHGVTFGPAEHYSKLNNKSTVKITNFLYYNEYDAYIDLMFISPYLLEEKGNLTYHDGNWKSTEDHTNEWNKTAITNDVEVIDHILKINEIKHNNMIGYYANYIYYCEEPWNIYYRNNKNMVYKSISESV
jgi:hypothetical protein